MGRHEAVHELCYPYWQELAGELVAEHEKATDEPAQIIPFPAHRWQQFAMME